MFLLFCLAPVLVLIGESVIHAAQGNVPLSLLLPLGRRWGLFVNSLAFAGASALGSMLLAAVLVTWGWRYSSQQHYQWRWGIVALAVVPPVVHGFVWSSLAGLLNGLLGFAGVSPVSTHGWWIAVAAQVTWLLPFALGIVAVSTVAIDRRYAEAARLLGTDLNMLVRVMSQLAKPVLAAGTALLFVMGMTDYSIPSLFQVNVYALEIFSEFSATGSAANALLLSVPSVALCSLLMVWIARTLWSHSVVQSSDVWAVAPHWPRSVVVVQAICLFFSASFLVFALVTLIGDVFSSKGLQETISSSGAELRSSITVASLGAVLCVIPAFSVARVLEGRKRIQSAVWWLLFLPVALPAPLVGLALIQFWNRPWLGSLYETPLLPALAGTARTVPWAVVLILMMLKRTDPGLLEAAKLLEGSHLRRFLQIRLPLVAPGVIASLVLLFVLALGELGATLLVLPPGMSTLTVRLYNFLHYGAADKVAGMTLLAVLISAGTGAVLAVLLFCWSRRFAGKGRTDA